MSKGPWGGKGSIKFKRVLREFTMGKLRSSAGAKVTSKRQALAIAYKERKEAQRNGAKNERDGRYGKVYSPYRPRKTKK